MAEALLEAVSEIIGALRVHVGGTEFLFCRNVEVELGVEPPSAVDLEDQDQDHRWDRRYPVQRQEAEAETHGWNSVRACSAADKE